MEITCELENMTAIGFTGSLQKLKLALEIADAYATNLPKSMDLSDEFTYVGDKIKLIVVPRGQTEASGVPTVSLIDQGIVASLSACIDRRTRANEQNMPAVALPTDPKHLQLNKAVHAAVAAGVVPNIDGHDGRMHRINAVEPRDTTLIEPQPEPLEIEGDYLISGSNVVGIHQPDLFDDKNVDMLPDVALARVDAEKTEASLIFDVHRSSLINSCGNEGTPSRASKPDIGLNPSKKVLEPSSCVPEPRHARGRLVVNEKDLVSQRLDH